MKKIIFVFLFVTVFAPIWADNSLLYEKGKNMVSTLKILADSDTYIDAINDSPRSQDFNNLLSKTRNCNYENEAVLYFLDISSDSDIMQVLSSKFFQLDVPDIVEDYMKTVLSKSLIPILTASFGNEETIKSCSLLDFSTLFSDRSFEQNCVLLFCYKNAYPVAITFIQGEDFTVNAIARYVFLDAFLDAVDEADFEKILENSLTLDHILKFKKIKPYNTTAK